MLLVQSIGLFLCICDVWLELIEQLMAYCRCRSEEKEGRQHGTQHRVQPQSQCFLYTCRPGTVGYSRRTSGTGLYCL